MVKVDKTILVHFSIITNGGNSSFWAQKTALKNQLNLHILLFTIAERHKIGHILPDFIDYQISLIF